MKKIIKITIFSLLAVVLLAGIVNPVPALAEDPPPPPEDPWVPPDDWVPPEDGDWVPPDDWVPPEDGDWIPPEDGYIPADGDGGVPPDGDWVMPPSDWIPDDSVEGGGWIPPDNFTPPDWWTPPEGWQEGDPLPPGTAPWEQLPGPGTPDAPFNPDTPEFGDTPGIPDATAPGGWASGDDGWMPPAEFDPPDWWTPPDGWQEGDPLPPGTAPWEQWTPELDDDFSPPTGGGGVPPPTTGGTIPNDGVPVDGWMPNDDGSWTPPAIFDPPQWWTPPEGWEEGDPLPEGTSPWEQIGLTPPDAGGFPGFEFPPGMEDIFGPGGPSIGDLEGVSLIPVPVPGSGFALPPAPFSGLTEATVTGNPEPLFDDEGNPIIDNDGDQVYGQPLLGDDGQPLMGNDGRPIYIVEDVDMPIGQGMPDMGQPGGWSEGSDGGWIPPENFDPPAWWTPPEGWEYGSELPAGTTPWEQIGLVDPNELDDIPPFVAPPGLDADTPDIGRIATVAPPVTVPARRVAPSGSVPLSTFGNFQFSPQVPLNNGDGDPVLDSDGDPVYVRMVLDEDGNPVVGPFGRPITILEE